MQSLAMLFSSLAVAAAAQGALPPAHAAQVTSRAAPQQVAVYVPVVAGSVAASTAANAAYRRSLEAAKPKKASEPSSPQVEALPSGVQVQHVVRGAGDRPGATDRVTVHYRGTLQDGTEFDSSFKRGEPITFGLNQVIPCWTQALQTMAVGGKAKLTCPSETAYGKRGIGPIPPNSTLQFDVELRAIEK